MLRDVLTNLPGFGTWPCDEINFVWKHGNMNYKYDDLPVEAVTDETVLFVQQQFNKIALKTDSTYVVEKTCANSMRVGYVDAIIPRARYIFLLREGCDAVMSAIERWERPVADLSYFLNKARFVAPGDMWQVILRATRNRLYGYLQPDARPRRTWGPMSGELDQYVNEGRPLTEICALQWTQCVEGALAEFGRMDSSRWITVGYERFVNEPEVEIRRILEMMSAEIDPSEIAQACGKVHSTSVGKSKMMADTEQLNQIEALVEPTMSLARKLLRA